MQPIDKGQEEVVEVEEGVLSAIVDKYSSE